VADLVLLDRDVVTGAPADIGAAAAVRTWVGGRLVHET
jgi:predicted amidohydrolase YtcJ